MTVGPMCSSTNGTRRPHSCPRSGGSRKALRHRRKLARERQLTRQPRAKWGRARYHGSARSLGGPALRYLAPVPVTNDRSSIGREVNRSRGNRHDDAFSAKAAKESFPQLVLDPVLVDEGRDMVPHRKVQ